MLQFSISLNVILTAGKVPHEVTPVHEVTLIRQEEADILNEGRHLHLYYLAAAVIVRDITFYPTDTLFTLRRPQTPQPPYRFDEEIVITEYTDSQGNEVHLEGTLSYPKGKGKFPTIVLVSGSGQQNRDEEIFQHKPFLVLADYLASRGIAVLRYDDRGVGKSTGALDNADTRLFAEDAKAMFRAA